VDRNVLIETAQAMGTGNLIENLLDLDFGAPSVTTPSNPVIETKTSQVMDLLSMDLEPMSTPASVTSPTPQESYLTSESAQGLELKGSFAKRYR
jgi:hypothetical protein